MTWSRGKEFEKFKNIFWMESFYTYIHILSRGYVEKKLWGSKNPENNLLKKNHPIKKEK